MKQEDIKAYVEHSMKLRRQVWIEDIVDDLNSKYKNTTVKYEVDSFIIDGDEEESLKIKEEIEGILEFGEKEWK